MTKEWEDELHNLLYSKEKDDETYKEVERIFQLTANYLMGYPFKTYPFLGYEALRYVCNNFAFETVLDVGCGEGLQSEEFLKEGKKVTAIDYGKSQRIKEVGKKFQNHDFEMIVADFNEYPFDRQFDLVWVCHMLEHQLNVQAFLEKVVGLVREGGLIAITVPPYKSEIVGGHVSLWNPGLLIYRMILSGVDCRNAYIKKYGYNISIIVEKRTISVLNDISYDVGDIKLLKKYFPEEIVFYNEYLGRDINFNGNLLAVNWK